MKTQQTEYQELTVAAYKDAFEHLLDELKRLDKILEINVYEFNKKLLASGSNSSTSPHFISNEEVACLISEPAAAEVAGDEMLSRLYSELQDIEDNIHSAVEHSLAAGVFLPLINLSKMFNMSWLEYQVVLICLAPELRRRYDKIYAYLQDDITRKRPSLDLVLQIFCVTETERWQARHLLNHDLSLMKYDLVQVVDDYHSPSGSSDLATFIRINKRILNYVLGVNILDDRLEKHVTIFSTNGAGTLVPLHTQALHEILDIMQQHEVDSGDFTPTVIHLIGKQGYGKKSLILRALQESVEALLVFDMSMLHDASPDEVRECTKLVILESIALQIPVYFRNLSKFHQDNKDGVTSLINIISEYHWIYFSDGCCDISAFSESDRINVRNIILSLPSVQESNALWDYYVNQTETNLENASVTRTLSEKFVLTPLAIKQIIFTKTADDPVMTEALIKKCQSHSNTSLIQLATKVPPGYSWVDIVLPDDTKSILQTICKQVNNKYKVFHDWGFDNKLRYGRGLSVLCCGSPGTGKTMAAQVIARDLKLDLYKIDLSNVVSKYIGETEKNLDKIFTEAETSNAVLFFDECDALFGKRTEVSDAHDRYANLEVSFLLQKMEEYDGIVILATNLRGNMDEAFIRRIRFIVEFPFPDQESRKQIWLKSLPELAPVSDDIDYEFLSKKLNLSGGNIKNIVLNAAFLASDENDAIAMKHMLLSARGEFQKIGKSWNENILLN